jgi:hypothetical protein
MKAALIAVASGIASYFIVADARAYSVRWLSCEEHHRICLWKPASRKSVCDAKLAEARKTGGWQLPSGIVQPCQ